MLNRQKSFENGKATLYLVPTPIGNLSEMTPRCIDVMKSVNYIAAEDTRNTVKLLNHFNIELSLFLIMNIICMLRFLNFYHY